MTSPCCPERSSQLRPLRTQISTVCSSLRQGMTMEMKCWLGLAAVGFSASICWVMFGLSRWIVFQNNRFVQPEPLPPSGRQGILCTLDEVLRPLPA